MQRSNNRLSVKIFWKNIKPWWGSEEKKIAWFGLIGVIILSLISVYIGVLLNEWSRNFYNTLENKNLDEFLHQVILFIPLVIFAVTEFCSRNYLVAWLSFRWRRWTTDQLENQWLSEKSYYKIPLITSVLDNPDQRISQDLSNICYSTIALFISFFRNGINFITFASMLWALSSQLQFSIAGHVLAIPGLLVWAAILYSIFGLVCTFKVGRPLITLDRFQEKYEADFRYRLMRIRERREEIATLSGELFEKNRLRECFIALTHNYYSILKRNIYINLFQNFYINASTFIPLFIVGPLYFAGAITMGVLMQIRGMFMQVNDSLTSVALSFTQIANLLASMQRIVDFKSRIESVKDHDFVLPIAGQDDRLEISNLDLSIPGGHGEWKVPTIRLQPNERKLLMAPSGRGKTSLLRIIAGISPFYEAHANTVIRIPKNMMFIPQRPYMPVGTLRQCFSYPSENFDDKTLLDAMKACYLEHLTYLLNEVQDYQQTLSLGEQQRVNFVRILLHQPKWIMMDEPTSQLNARYVDSLCQLLTERLPSAGILAISHDKLPYFDEVIGYDENQKN